MGLEGNTLFVLGLYAKRIASVSTTTFVLHHTVSGTAPDLHAQPAICRNVRKLIAVSSRSQRRPATAKITRMYEISSGHHWATSYAMAKAAQNEVSRSLKITKEHTISLTPDDHPIKTSTIMIIHLCSLIVSSCSQTKPPIFASVAAATLNPPASFRPTNYPLRSPHTCLQTIITDQPCTVTCTPNILPGGWHGTRHSAPLKTAFCEYQSRFRVLFTQGSKSQVFVSDFTRNSGRFLMQLGWASNTDMSQIIDNKQTVVSNINTICIICLLLSSHTIRAQTEMVASHYYSPSSKCISST